MSSLVAKGHNRPNTLIGLLGDWRGLEDEFSALVRILAIGLPRVEPVEPDKSNCWFDRVRRDVLFAPSYWHI